MKFSLKYTWNIYVFITYKNFLNYFYSKLIVNKKKNYTFCQGQKLRNTVEL